MRELRLVAVEVIEEKQTCALVIRFIIINAFKVLEIFNQLIGINGFGRVLLFIDIHILQVYVNHIYIVTHYFCSQSLLLSSLLLCALNL
jgi:hypothetical protein